MSMSFKGAQLILIWRLPSDGFDSRSRQIQVVETGSDSSTAKNARQNTNRCKYLGLLKMTFNTKDRIREEEQEEYG